MSKTQSMTIHRRDIKTGDTVLFADDESPYIEVDRPIPPKVYPVGTVVTDSVNSKVVRAKDGWHTLESVGENPVFKVGGWTDKLVESSKYITVIFEPEA